MRTRMSRSYNEGLRGLTQINCNLHSTLEKSDEIPQPLKHHLSPLNLKMSSLSLPPLTQHVNISKIVSFHSASTLPDHDSNNKAESVEMVPQEINQTEAAFKNQHDRLTVPPVGDYCIRISNSLVTDDPPTIGLNDSRISDALGYLKMYRNSNRIQFNALEFNDREDLQVNLNEKKKDFF